MNPLDVAATSPDLLPLAPFLESLKADCIHTTLHDHERIHLVLRTQGPWTSRRLRSTLAALLAQDAEQELIFRRRFDQFFGVAEEQATLPDIDLERALADLGKLGQEPVPEEQSAGRRAAPRSRSQSPSAGARRWLVPFLAGILVLAIGAWAMWRDFPWERPSIEPPTRVENPDDQTSEDQASEDQASEDEPSEDQAPEDLPPEGQPSGATYVVPVITDVQPLDAPRANEWKATALVAIGLLLILLAYAGWLWRMCRPPDDTAPEYDPDAPRCFRVGEVGGEPAPRLDPVTLDLLADALGYFKSQQPGHRLDVYRSIEAIGNNGGAPHLVFKRRKRIRGVVVLEDTLAEARAWNPVADELVRGLEIRGIPIIHALFRGAPKRFRTADATELALEDLEDDNNCFLLLVFSDGKGLYRKRDGFVLETLKRWPRVAWMELRERRAWDESTAAIARAGLPVYPASREGLLKVLEHFATERAFQDDFSQDPDTWRGYSLVSAARLRRHHLERALGDALPWAESCAMMPVLGLGLADALRRQFHPEIPAERIERLLSLPEASLTSSGLVFSPLLLTLLRHGFLVYNDEKHQRDVIDFLLTEVAKAEPTDATSLEHHAWEWKLERLRLEIDPDRALKRLSALAKGPLGSTIRGQLSKARLVSEVDDPTAAIPLRAKPRSRRGLQRLLRLAKESGVRARDAYPVSAGHRIALTVLLLGCLAAGTWATWTRPRTIPLRWENAAGVPPGVGRIEVRSQDQWELVHEVDLSRSGLAEFPLDRGQEYRAWLRRAVFNAGMETTRNLGKLNRGLTIVVGAEARELPETVADAPAIGMEILQKSAPDSLDGATRLNGLGAEAYARGDLDQAAEYYEASLEILQSFAPGSVDVAASLNNLKAAALTALSYILVDRLEFEQSFGLLEEARGLQENDPSGKAVIQVALGWVHHNSGHSDRARQLYEEALRLFSRIGNKDYEARVRYRLGLLDQKEGRHPEALSNLKRALEIFDNRGEVDDQVETLLRIALSLRRMDASMRALEEVDRALALIEELRKSLLNSRSRAVFFASKQHVFEFKIELLMELHERDPDRGFDLAALAASEQARARSLIQKLDERGVDLRSRADPELLKQKERLLRKIKLALFQSDNEDSDQIDLTRSEVQRLQQQYDMIRAEIRSTHPFYAALIEINPLGVDEIRQRVLDEDTLLLEYFLGRESCYAWVLTSDSVTSWKLEVEPGVLEGAARMIYKLLPLSNQRRYRVQLEFKLALLSDQILGPIIDDFGDKRLLIASSGALQYVPFAALPLPGEQPAESIPDRLVSRHEIVNISSASTLGIQRAVIRREQMQGRRPAPETAFVLADPVYDAWDARLTPSSNATRMTEVPSYRRLEYSGEETKVIRELVGATVAMGFDANKEFLMNSRLGRYRYVHLATLSTFDAQFPERSRLIFSLYDKAGNVQEDAALYLHEAYQLDLSADLVVLSAGQTALGEEIRGEGLVGLTHGFMCSGARRVLASLWHVSDEAKAELMRLFYNHLFRDGISPSAALRRAQVDFLNRHPEWADPHYWAGFILYGDF